MVRLETAATRLHCRNLSLISISTGCNERAGSLPVIPHVLILHDSSLQNVLFTARASIAGIRRPMSRALPCSDRFRRMRRTKTARCLEFAYSSYPRTLALFNRQTLEIIVDGNPVKQDAIFSAGIWGVRLPRGRHRVEVVADSTASVIVDTSSLYSSSLIVIFGGGFMVLLYLSILARRALGRAVRGRAN